MIREMRSSWRISTTGVLAVLVSALLIVGCGSSGDESELVGMSDVKLADSHKAALPAWGPGHKGEVKQIRPESGSFLVVYFGYTFCPDVCPTTLSGLGAAVRMLPKEDQKEIEAAMVTVDAARDKGPNLVKYVRHFFPDSAAWAFRTTDQKELDKTEQAFGAGSEIDPHKKGESYTVTHTASLYVVDRNGRVVLIWPYGTLNDDIASDLKLLLARQGENRSGEQ